MSSRRGVFHKDTKTNTSAQRTGVMSKEFSVFGHENLNNYIFKESINIFSFMHKAKIKVTNQEDGYMSEKFPIVLDLIKNSEKGNMENVVRADFLALFILTEQKRSVHYEKVKFDEIKTIPMPPFVPQSFFASLESSIDRITC